MEVLNTTLGVVAAVLLLPILITVACASVTVLINTIRMRKQYSVKKTHDVLLKVHEHLKEREKQLALREQTMLEFAEYCATLMRMLEHSESEIYSELKEKGQEVLTTILPQKHHEAN